MFYPQVDFGFISIIVVVVILLIIIIICILKFSIPSPIFFIEISFVLLHSLHNVPTLPVIARSGSFSSMSPSSWTGRRSVSKKTPKKCRQVPCREGGADRGLLLVREDGTDRLGLPKKTSIISTLIDDLSRNVKPWIFFFCTRCDLLHHCSCGRFRYLFSSP